MIDRLRGALNRPIADHQRQRAFALAAALVLLAVAGLALTREPGRQTGGHGPQPPEAPPSQEAPAPAPRHKAPSPRAVPAMVTRAGRRFLTGYLAYLYGHASAQRIAGADRTLVRRLARERARVSPATRARHPRIVALTPHRLTPARWSLAALVDDGGVARYTVTTLLERRRGSWVVTAVGDD